ncbi:hypothetical protein C8J47_0790 [Sphingomonas sp. PP-F2F-G114-C0414]|nr:hypothetical protein C8J47_0790 [Sphingomonas sp. PP-F2F-G114-C0414]
MPDQSADIPFHVRLRHPRGGGDPDAQTVAITSRGLPLWVPACAGMTVHV